MLDLGLRKGAGRRWRAPSTAPGSGGHCGLVSGEVGVGS
jgi:hypothetical protein